MVAACKAASARGSVLPADQRVINVGGPERLNRVEMALAVADVRGYDPALVLSGSAWAPSVKRVCATPADISMDCTRAAATLGLQLTPFKQALREIFAS
jgi:nucleoside-diphosphate-sugar epimerase